MAWKSWSRNLGIDLGTANILVYAEGQGIVLREPSVVAVEARTQRVLAIGEEAHEMVGRTPGGITAVRPLADGVIADFDMTEVLLRRLLQKVIGTRFRMAFPPRIVVCAPCGVTEVERRAVEDVVRSAGARSTMLVEEPMAAAIGAGLDVADATGSMVVDIGGGTTEVAVISLGGIVQSASLRIAGNHMNETLCNYIRRQYDLLVGERTAEEIKINLGSAYPVRDDMAMEFRGRDLTMGLPRTMRIGAAEVREALAEPVQSIVEVIRNTLEETPPELSSDIMSGGIVLTGGGAMLYGLDRCISEATGLPVRVAENPLDCVAIGAGKIAAAGYDMVSTNFA